jgi:hypothetical protein
MKNNQVNLNVTLDKTVPVTCEECGNNVFVEGLLLRKVSRFLTGQNQDGIIPIPVFSCSKCQHVNEEFIPSDLKKQD